VALLYHLVRHPEFIDANLTTRFLGLHDVESKLQQAAPVYVRQAAQVLAVQKLIKNTSQSEQVDPCQSLSGWRLNDSPQFHVQLQDSLGNKYISSLTQQDDRQWLIRDQALDLTSTSLPATTQLELVRLSEQQLVVVTDQGKNQVTIDWFLDNNRLILSSRGRRYDFTLSDPDHTETADDDAQHHFDAPMHGTIVSVDAQPGDPVEKGDTLLVLEAMKMEYRITAPYAGHVRQIRCLAGDTVERGVCLAEMDPIDQRLEGSATIQSEKVEV
jgi:3-methylcrotonyl-CoA carboxylase alpha subunit